MHRKVTVSSFDMIMSLSFALDLVDSRIVHHHKRVAYLAAIIADELDLSKEVQYHVTVAAAVHDIGALSLAEVEQLHVFGGRVTSDHAEIGYRMIRDFAPFAKVAPIIRAHHVSWEQDEASRRPGDRVPIENHVLHFADRLEVMIDYHREILHQVPEIVAQMREHAGSLFMPEVVDAFVRLSEREVFWLDLISPHLDALLHETLASSTFGFELDLDSLLGISKLFSQIIDFRTPFTATHSSGVAIVAEALAVRIGFSHHEGILMRVAGYLHDLGKLAIAAEILNKPGRLTDEEMRLIRKHTYYTYQTLKTIGGLDTINAWASFHHETLDGEGYPFHHDQDSLPLGSRVMSVADIFTALSEDRPYRRGMEKAQVVEILQGMASRGKIDAAIVERLIAHYDEIDALRRAEQEVVRRAYEKVIQPADQKSA
jgi:HD-GYP domain-containing protein (c-di-GMP phosphodiesterase class II)